MCGFCTAFLEKKLCSEGGITNVQTSHSSREQMSANFTLFLGARIFVFRSNPYIFRFHRICVGIAIFSLFRTETNLFLDPNSLAATVTEERGRGRSLSLSLRSPFSAAANRRPNRFLSNWAGRGMCILWEVGRCGLRRWGKYCEGIGRNSGRKEISLLRSRIAYSNSGKLQR